MTARLALDFEELQMAFEDRDGDGRSSAITSKPASCDRLKTGHF